MIRFMLMEQTYVLSGKWLDATGGNAMDNVAAESYRHIISMLRWGLRTVYVNDIENVMGRGRRSERSYQMFLDRDMGYDNMSLLEVKQLCRVALQDWEGERSRIRNLEPHELAFHQMLVFDIDDLRQRVADLPPAPAEGEHPAAGIGEQLEEVQQGLEGVVMNDEERAVVFPEGGDGAGDPAGVAPERGGSNIVQSAGGDADAQEAGAANAARHEEDDEGMFDMNPLQQQWFYRHG